jgi:hypothetical protein
MGRVHYAAVNKKGVSGYQTPSSERAYGHPSASVFDVLECFRRLMSEKHGKKDYADDRPDHAADAPQDDARADQDQHL